MFRKIVAGLLVAFTLTVTVSPLSAATRGTKRGLFYVVKSPKATLYILGSIHLANRNLYPLPSRIISAFNHSDNVVVEVNTGSEAYQETQQKMIPMLLYRGKETIKDHLSDETYEMLKEYLKKSQIPLVSVRKFKPGLLAIAITSKQLMLMGFLTKYGIENCFLGLVHGTKNIYELESAGDQLSLFLSIDDPDMYIKHTLMDIENMRSVMGKIISAWKAGDAEKLNKMLLIDPVKQEPKMISIIKSFFYDRNITMTKKLEKYLNTGGNYFVIVGAGHLVGDKGIIALLKKTGKYSIEQPE